MFWAKTFTFMKDIHQILTFLETYHQLEDPWVHSTEKIANSKMKILSNIRSSTSRGLFNYWFFISNRAEKGGVWIVLLSLEMEQVFDEIFSTNTVSFLIDQSNFIYSYLCRDPISIKDHKIHFGGCSPFHKLFIPSFPTLLFLPCWFLWIVVVVVVAHISVTSAFHLSRHPDIQFPSRVVLAFYKLQSKYELIISKL